VTHVFGTVVANQTRVRVRIVESGTAPDRPHVVLGDCEITQLPPNLPEGAEIEVTISYDRQARVHVTAREPLSNRAAEVELVRRENISDEGTGGSQAPGQTASSASPSVPASAAAPAKATAAAKAPTTPPAPAAERAQRKPASDANAGLDVRDLLEQLSDFSPPGGSAAFSDQPVLLCNSCGKPLGRGGICPACRSSNAPAETRRRPPRAPESRSTSAASKPNSPAKPSTTSPKPAQPDVNADEFWEIIDGD
jgi:molecular chaperone DnaK